MQVALLEKQRDFRTLCRNYAHLQKQQHRAALGTIAGLSDQLKLIETVLKAASRISQQQDTDGGDERENMAKKKALTKVLAEKAGSEAAKIGKGVAREGTADCGREHQETLRCAQPVPLKGEES